LQSRSSGYRVALTVAIPTIDAAPLGPAAFHIADAMWAANCTQSVSRSLENEAFTDSRIMLQIIISSRD
jgi:hypothetical protein